MAAYIVQAALQAEDELPRNRFENVWHFSSFAAEASVAEATTICAALQGFYDAWSQWRSPICLTTATFKVYLEGAAKPRPEYYQTALLVGASSGSALPEEIALCLSYFSGRNLAGLRGRVYLGPLNTSALTTGSDEGGNSVRPTAAFRAALISAGQALETATNVGTLKWCILSEAKTGRLYNPITDIWVDDEWDGQRRRRLAATTRSSLHFT